MSKLDRTLLKQCIENLLAFSNGETIKCPDPKKAEDYTGEPPETDPPTLHKMGRGNVKDGMVTGKKRNFTETVELQIALKNYDPSKDKRFSGTFKLPTVPKPGLKYCLLGTEADCERAKKIGLDCLTEDDLKKFKKDKKLVKKLAGKYDGFLASAKLIKKVPRLLGPGLNRAGKFPTVVSPTQDFQAKIDELGATIKFQMKKVLCLNVAIANCDQSADQIETNVVLATNFLASLLKKNWQNIGVLYLKSTMGPRFQIYF
jgi:large subunit ribosomal protein L10Ae